MVAISSYRTLYYDNGLYHLINFPIGRPDTSNDDSLRLSEIYNTFYVEFSHSQFYEDILGRV